MTKEEVFRELIATTARGGKISSADYKDLLQTGSEIGIDKQTVDLMIKVELKKNESSDDETDDSDNSTDNEKHVFKSAVSRGGSILTPDIIIIDKNGITYKKRNKYLINVDTVTIPYTRISSVEINSGLVGTEIIIDSFGKGAICVKRFSKSDAKEIKRLIDERMR